MKTDKFKEICDEIHESEGKEIISSMDHYICRKIKEQIDCNNYLSLTLGKLEERDTEVELFGSIEGIAVKCKVDRIVSPKKQAYRTIIDIKTSQNPYQMVRESIEKSYARQLAFYDEILRQNDNSHRFYVRLIFAVSVNKPFNIVVYEISEARKEHELGNVIRPMLKEINELKKLNKGYDYITIY